MWVRLLPVQNWSMFLDVLWVKSKLPKRSCKRLRNSTSLSSFLAQPSSQKSSRTRTSATLNVVQTSESAMLFVVSGQKHVLSLLPSSSLFPPTRDLLFYKGLLRCAFLWKSTVDSSNPPNNWPTGEGLD